MAKDTEKEGAPTDTELVNRCLAGDEAAWTQLITRYQRLIYSVARAICADPDDSNDVFQYTCLDLYRGLHELRDIQALPAWLITVSRRRAISLMRSSVSVEPSEEDAAQELAADDVIRTI